MYKCKLRPFEHTQSMSKWPAGLAYIDYSINYLFYFSVPFLRGLCIDLEGSSIFLPLKLLIHINRLGLFRYLYRTLLNYLSVCPGSWVGTTTLCIEVEWYCTIAVSAWCSVHQLLGCECTGNRFCIPLGCQNDACMGIYGHIQLYIHAFTCIYELKIYICIMLHLYVYFFCT